MLKRTNLPSQYLATALPFLEKIIEEEYQGYPQVSKEIFNVETIKYGIAQHTQNSALNAPAEVAEGEEVPQERTYPGFSTTYVTKKYGMLLVTSQEAIDDEKFSSISKNARKIGRAFASAEEITASAIFNTAHSVTGSDGKVLCAVDHPLLTPGSGTSSNRLAVAADLSIGSLKDMIIGFKKQLDTAGNKLQIKPKKLLVPSELEFLATELLGSEYLPEGNLNNINSVKTKFGIAPLCWEYLTDSDSCFLLGDVVDTELYWMWSKQLEIKSDEEFKSDAALTRALARWTVGYSDWRGIFSNGGGA